jgi:tetratricopeptide (TPR) repeat protein
MFLLPVFYLPVVLDPQGMGKIWMAGVMAFVGLTLWLIGMILDKKGKVKLSWFMGLLTLFLIWSVWGWFRMPMGVRISSLMYPFGLGTTITFWVWYFLFVQVEDKEEFGKQLLWLSASGVLVVIVSLVLFLIPGKSFPINWPNANNPLLSIGGQSWSLTGSLMSELILLFFLGFVWLTKLIKKLKKKEGFNYLWEMIMVVVFGLGFGLAIFNIIKFGLLIMPYSSAWIIAVETLKGNMIQGSSIFGVGPGNYLLAFNLFKPAIYNLTQYWTSVFNLSSMGVLHIWTELGIVGLLMTIWGFLALIKKRKNKSFSLMMILALMFLFLPLNLITITLLVWILSNVASENNETKMVLNVGEKNLNIMPWIVSILLSTGIVFAGIWWFKFIAGEVTIRKSLVSAAANDGKKTYELQIKAISFNPYIDSYRRLYSQTNLSLAAGILQTENIQDADKEQASTLIQQSVREAKSAIALNGASSINWVNLAGIYQQLIGVVDGTADWAYQAYQQAVTYDPTNPLTRLDMGGLLFAAQRYEEAGRVFEQVVRDKQDFANAWYNLAYADKALGKIDIAVADLQQALMLVPRESGDYEKANQELEVWKKELEEAIKKQQEYAKQQQMEEAAKPKEPETLKAPQVAPKVGEEEKVDVPAEQIQPPEVAPLPVSENETGTNPEVLE